MNHIAAVRPDTCLMLASWLTVAVGLVHSVFGEWLIFRRLQRCGLVPNAPVPPLRISHLRILWASWHLATLMGWGLAAVLWWMAQQPPSAWIGTPLAGAISGAMILSALMVCYGTRGRHPGWLGLLAIGVLVWSASARPI